MGRWIALSLLVLCAWPAAAPAQEQGRVAIYPQLGHTLVEDTLAFSPDGKTLASGSWDNTIKLWDVATGRELRSLGVPRFAVTAVAFSPDGKTLASGSWDKAASLWDVATGRELRTLSGQSGSAVSLAFVADGKTLALIGDDSSVKLWDWASGRALAAFNGHINGVSAAAFSRDGKTLAAGCKNDNLVRVWDMTDRHGVRTFAGHTGSITAIAFSPDARTIASGSRDNTVKLWNVETGRELQTLKGHSAPVVALTFSPDSTVLASGSSDNTTKLWDVASGRELMTLRGHTNGVASLVFSRDGKTLASGGWDNAIVLWDVASGRKIATFSGHSSAISSIAVSRDGSMLASGSWDNAIRLWAAATGRLLGTLTGHSGAVSSIAFSSDGRMLASASKDATVKLWDTASGRELRTLTGHSSAVHSIALSPNGRLLASGSDDRTVKLWNVSSGNLLRTLRHKDRVLSVAFAPDGATLATTSADRTIELWNASSGHELMTLSGQPDVVHFVAFSPDGHTLASASQDATIGLWDVAGGRELKTLGGHLGAVGSLAFSADGRTLVSGSWDSTVRLWDVASGRQLKTFRSLGAPVYSVAFSPARATIVSGGADGAVRIWDVSTGAERVALIGFDDGGALAVTPEGFFDSSSEQAEENINVRVDNRVFGISSFRDNFYRPDLVQKALAGEDISRFGSIDNVKLSPEVKFAGLPSATKDPNLKVTLNLTNGGGGFGPVRVFWNGTVVQQDSDVPTSGETLSRSYTIALLNGDNEVRATAFNADGSMWSEARSTVAANLPVTRLAGAHGTLRAIVVGIQNFPKAPSHDLKYDAADAKLIADTLTRKAAPLFDKLDIELLPPAQSDKSHIVHALMAMQASAGPDDEFVFYAASHGIVMGSQYYLLASDMIDPPNPANLSAHALSIKELGDLLANIHAGKKLVILDTCDSGSAGRALSMGNGVTAQTTATVLGRDLGFTVLSATASNQDALEGGTNGHGLFTYVLNDGLSGKAFNRATGIVTSFLLADYVKKRVPAMAQSVLHRDQQPTTETSGKDFPVTKVR